MYNNQDLVTTQISNGIWENKEIMVCVHSGQLVSYNKKIKSFFFFFLLMYGPGVYHVKLS